MTKIIESIAVEVGCGEKDVDGYRDCEATNRVTIVSTVETGDLVLTPVGWQATVIFGQIILFCPDHKKEK